MFDLGFGNSECGLKSPARAGLFFVWKGRVDLRNNVVGGASQSRC